MCCRLAPGFVRFFALGMVAGVNVHVLADSLLAPFTGLPTVWSSLGVGRWLGSTVRGGRLVTFRLLPLVLVSAAGSSSPGPGCAAACGGVPRSPCSRRCWPPRR